MARFIQVMGIGISCLLATGSQALGGSTAGGALSFSWAEEDFVLLSDNDIFDFPNDFTLECWVNCAGSAWTIVKHNHGSNGDGSWALTVPGRVAFTIWNGANSLFVESAPGSVHLNEWTHIAVTYNSTDSQFVIFINGNPETTVQAMATIANNDAPLRFGAEDGRFDGRLDEVRLWNITRTPAQIQAYFDKVVSPDSVGLIGYWRFDEGASDQVVHDLTSNANHGLIGSTNVVETNDPTRIQSDAPIVGPNAVPTVSGFGVCFLCILGFLSAAVLFRQRGPLQSNRSG